MNNELKHIDPEHIIGKYLSGQASNNEIRWLEKWVLENEENKKMFIRSRQSWNLSDMVNIHALDPETEWSTVKEMLVRESNVIRLPKRSETPFRSSLIRIAAVFLILIMAGFWMYRSYLNTGVEYYKTDQLVSIEQLSDGSVVSLNRDAEISFINKKTRNASLKGDAFFEVSHDKAHPFIVKTNNLEIEVIGTSFYVNARENGLTSEVIVKSGKVAVSHGSDKLILSSGEKAVFDKRTKKLVLSENEDINYLSWKTKTLVFEDSDLIDVVNKLSEVYNANITLAGEKLNNCKITVTFKQQDLSSILPVIEKTLDLKVSVSDREIKLTGRPCLID